MGLYPSKAGDPMGLYPSKGGGPMGLYPTLRAGLGCRVRVRVRDYPTTQASFVVKFWPI